MIIIIGINSNEKYLIGFWKRNYKNSNESSHVLKLSHFKRFSFSITIIILIINYHGYMLYLIYEYSFQVPFCFVLSIYSPFLSLFFFS